MKKALSKLAKVELRDVWDHEALDFTKWLAQQENLDLLGEEIGIDIKLTRIEAPVGKFSVDILAEEDGTGRKIIIENQLEDTNHDHLGKIITYASGYDAEVIIWIVRDVREEYQKAIDWLNEHTDDKISFFLIKIELWKIEGSNPAPKFETIVAPNEWAKVIKKSGETGELTNTKIQQLDFWTNFRKYVKNTNDSIRLRTPRPQHWYNISVGSSDAHIGLTINSQKNLLGCEVYINKNKELFRFLSSKKEAIERELGYSLEYIDAPIASRIIIKQEVVNLFHMPSAEKHFKWFYDNMCLFQHVFGKYLMEFKGEAHD